jgi:hypothetical protein
MQQTLEERGGARDSQQELPHLFSTLGPLNSPLIIQAIALQT